MLHPLSHSRVLASVLLLIALAPSAPEPALSEQPLPDPTCEGCSGIAGNISSVGSPSCVGSVLKLTMGVTGGGTESCTYIHATEECATEGGCTVDLFFEYSTPCDTTLTLNINGCGFGFNQAFPLGAGASGTFSPSFGIDCGCALLIQANMNAVTKGSSATCTPCFEVP